MQVDPIKPTLKAPAAGHLKPKCDELLSNFAFNFNLRRYTAAAGLKPAQIAKPSPDDVAAAVEAASRLGIVPDDALKRSIRAAVSSVLTADPAAAAAAAAAAAVGAAVGAGAGAAAGGTAGAAPAVESGLGWQAAGRLVGPGRHPSPRHLTHRQRSFLDANIIP